MAVIGLIRVGRWSDSVAAPALVCSENRAALDFDAVRLHCARFAASGRFEHHIEWALRRSA